MRFIPLRKSESEERAILLMHGSTQQHYDKEHPLFKIVKDLPMDVFSVELPGHGESRFDSQKTPQDYVTLFLEEFTRQMQSLPYKEINIVGYSLGGLLGLKTMELKNERIRKIVGIGTGLFVNKERARIIRSFFSEKNFEVMNQTSEMRRIHGARGWKFLINLLHVIFDPTSPLFLDKEKIKGTPSKALIIIGENDEPFDAFGTAKKCRDYFNIRCVVIKGVGHFEYFSKGVKQLPDLLLPFLKEGGKNL